MHERIKRLYRRGMKSNNIKQFLLLFLSIIVAGSCVIVSKSKYVNVNQDKKEEIGLDISPFKKIIVQDTLKIDSLK